MCFGQAAFLSRKPEAGAVGHVEHADGGRGHLGAYEESMHHLE